MFLIEKLQAETSRDVQAFLESLVCEVYGGRPAWLNYELRDDYRFRGRDFVSMFCPAGSFIARLSLRATTGDGLSRDILQLGTRDGQLHAWLVHRGHESEYDPDEIERVG
jgi:hypothetical protein